MNSKKFFGNIKFIVLIGYSILFILSIFGVAQVYRELVKLSSKQTPFENQQDLTYISNALISMYETESIRKVMLSDNFDTTLVNMQYQKVNNKVNLYIDSLYNRTSDNYLQLQLDTVKILLVNKDLNFRSMIPLFDSIRNLPYSQKIQTTVLSKKDIDYLDKLIKKSTEIKTDSSFIKKDKKGFFARVKDVFSAQADSLKVISKQDIKTQDSVYFKPAKMLNDTIIQYIETITNKQNKNKILYVSGIHIRQNAMLYYDEMLANQINNILRRIEYKQNQAELKLLSEKELALKNSYNFVSGIALVSLFILILFIIYTLVLINRSQTYREQLEKSKKTAEDLMNSRERLLLMISHDIKSPLSSIFGHIDLLTNNDLSEKNKNYIVNLRNASEQILDLVNKLLDYHKLEQGQSEINEVEISPYHLMEDIYNSFIPIAENKKLQLVSENKIDQNEFYECDPFAVKQIANNLISNAIKFTPQGAIKIFSSIHNNNLEIRIKDNGIGIKEEDKNKIFDEFRRVGTLQTQRETEGYGLGLAITNKLIKLLGGKISFTSEYGKGTEFIVSLPLVKPRSSEKKESLEKDIESIEYPKQVKVLFIDDDIVLLNVFKKLLQREGSEVTTCSDPTLVMELIQNESFDIIFTDIQMPQIIGFDLVKKIRKLGKRFENLPIIALSGRYDITLRKFQEAGFTSFLAKPVPFKALSQAIQTYVVRENRTEVIETEINKQSSFYAIIEYLEDDPETSLDLLNVFVSENEIKISDLNVALKKRDWETIKTVAHKLLPLMKMIDADEIVAILIDIENGKTNNKQVELLIVLVTEKNDEVQRFIDIKFASLINV